MMISTPKDIRRFKQGEHENLKFWSRFGGRPPMKDICVLDVGCGRGSLCIDMGLAGARRVVGADINSHRIDVANEMLRREYPQLVERVEFKCIDLVDYKELGFDYVVSKDTFEHVLELEETLRQMERRLEPGGKIYVGFGPLYNSPFGGHSIAREVWGRLVPWGHLLLSEATIVERLSRHRGEEIKSIHDIGLNKHSLADYRKILRESGLTILFFETNCSDKLASRIMSLLAKIPPLEEYFTHNLYCILQKQP